MTRPEVAAWEAFVDGLRSAGERLAASTADLDDIERADGYRALVRALHNQLGRFEVDRDRPELVPFNTWRQKFFMDNPDFRYWVADVRAGSRYLVRGSRGDAAFMSVTAYAGKGPTQAGAASRLDSDAIAFDDDGGFSITIGAEPPEEGDWLALPEGANALWVRQFHDDVQVDRPGWCTIEPLDAVATPPPIDADRFAHHLRRLGSTMAVVPGVFAEASAADHRHVNEIRHWSEMTGGAVYTEPGIHYLRGGWELAPDEALVVEGEVVDCRYWNVLLYSRYLNSLDQRARSVSRTGATATLDGGRYRFVLSGEDPGPGPFDWLDTERRPFGIIVLRWLQPATTPELPAVRRCKLADLPAW